MIAKSRYCLTLSALAVALFTPNTAKAWGNEGHQTIGLIAEHFLSTAERAEVKRLLSLPIDPDLPATMRDRATWGDAYRDSDRNTTKIRYTLTRNWHFVDLEFDNPDFASACFGDVPLRPGANPSQGNAQECVVQKIEEFRAVLADKARPDAERALALNFMLHFVGDVHQPLHAAERQKDQGGNLVLVVTGTSTNGSNLHSFWDTATVNRLGSSPETISAALIGDITPGKLASWRKGNARDWALQSYKIAHDVTYALPTATRSCSIRARDGTTKQETCIVLDEGYRTKAAGKVHRQLEVAGVRLAWMISQALK
ncbi:S1/P1 nuclease [Sphingomonas sp. SUN039]|uniref:S1/P1 nuclease n=1 Tax=Sphingomonas sp. SUN039 TaxID=2937787 RepID=UPI0021644348|nr:S1/P1 nuclease [Sphingomonas sp. SUN039]UVO53743.1 S1/P1 nuclease [Sphingomonas sp. SUN039]